MTMMAVALVASAQHANKHVDIQITVTNDSKVARKNEPVVLKLKDVTGCNFDVKQAYLFLTSSLSHSSWTIWMAITI